MATANDSRRSASGGLVHAFRSRLAERLIERMRRLSARCGLGGERAPRLSAHGRQRESLLFGRSSGRVAAPGDLVFARWDMHPDNRKQLAHKVSSAAESALYARGFVTSIDVLVGVGWLTPAAVESWRAGRTDYLERVVISNLSRISEAMRLFRSWASAKGLKPSETAYVLRRPGRPALRFSKSGDPGVERLYRTHWVSPALSDAGREPVDGPRAPRVAVKFNKTRGRFERNEPSTAGSPPAETSQGVCRGGGV